MMLRLVVCLAASLLSARARAQTVIPDVAVANGWAAFLRDNGSYAALVVLLAYVVFLLRSSAKKDERIYAMAASTAKLVGDTTAALQSFETAAKSAAALNAERWDAVKSMSVDIARVGLLVGGNGDGLKTVQTTLQALLLQERR